MPARQIEAGFQEAVVRYLRLSLRDCVIYHNANGGARSFKTAKLMKRIGVLAGVFDLTILAPNGRAIFIECKIKGGTLSPAQTAFKLALIRMGFDYAVIRNFDDLEAALVQWGFKRRSAFNAMEYGDLLGRPTDRPDSPTPHKRKVGVGTARQAKK